MLGVQTSNDGSAVSGAPAGFDVSEAQMVERELERASDSDSLQGDQHLVCAACCLCLQKRASGLEGRIFHQARSARVEAVIHQHLPQS